jgi:hypothetical protein
MPSSQMAGRAARLPSASGGALHRVFLFSLYIIRAPSLRNPWIFPRVDFAVVVLDGREAPKVMRPLDSYCVVPYLDLSPEYDLRPFLC